jgi:hypothetical protein
MKDKEKDKIIYKSIYLILYAQLIQFLITCTVASVFMEENSPLQITIILGSLLIFVIACVCAVIVESHIGHHICKKCNNEFQPEFKTIILAPHIGTTRYLKCPKCNEKSWCKKSIEK